MFDFFSLRNCISNDIYMFMVNVIFNLIYSIRAKKTSLHLFSSPNPAPGDLLVVVDSGI